MSRGYVSTFSSLYFCFSTSLPRTHPFTSLFTFLSLSLATGTSSSFYSQIVSAQLRRTVLSWKRKRMKPEAWGNITPEIFPYVTFDVYAIRHAKSSTVRDVWTKRRIVSSLFFILSNIFTFTISLSLSLSLSLLPVRIYSHHYIFLALYRLYAYQEVCRYICMYASAHAEP